MSCAGCAMNKGPSNLWGPQQFEELQPIWVASRNMRGLCNLRNSQQSEWPQQFWRAPRNLRSPSNLRAHSNLMGPQQSWRPSLSSLRGLTNLRGPAIWEAPSNLRCTQQTEGPRQSEGRAPENCCHFAQAFVWCCQVSTRSTIFKIVQLLLAALCSVNYIQSTRTALHVVEVVSDCCNIC